MMKHPERNSAAMTSHDVKKDVYNVNKDVEYPYNLYVFYIHKLFAQLLGHCEKANGN